MVYYFKTKIDEKTDYDHTYAGYIKFLTDYDKIRLICFLADLVYLYRRFQKQIQADNVLILDVEDPLNVLKTRIPFILHHYLVAGKRNLKKDCVIVDEDVFLFDIQLFKLSKNSTSRRRKIHHLYVSDHRCFDAIKNESIESILSSETLIALCFNYVTK